MNRPSRNSHTGIVPPRSCNREKRMKKRKDPAAKPQRHQPPENFSAVRIFQTNTFALTETLFLVSESFVHSVTLTELLPFRVFMRSHSRKQREATRRRRSQERATPRSLQRPPRLYQSNETMAACNFPRERLRFSPRPP